MEFPNELAFGMLLLIPCKLCAEGDKTSIYNSFKCRILQQISCEHAQVDVSQDLSVNELNIPQQLSCETNGLKMQIYLTKDGKVFN